MVATGWGPALADLFGVDVDKDALSKLEFAGMDPKMVMGALAQRSQQDLGARELNAKQNIAEQQFGGQQPMQLMKLYTDLAMHQAQLANQAQMWREQLGFHREDAGTKRGIEQAKLGMDMYKVNAEGERARDVANIGAAGRVAAADRAHQPPTPQARINQTNEKTAGLMEKQRTEAMAKSGSLTVADLLANPDKYGPHYRNLVDRANELYGSNIVDRNQAILEGLSTGVISPPKPKPDPVLGLLARLFRGSGPQGGGVDLNPMLQAGGY
jgi:hypothetical protein